MTGSPPLRFLALVLSGWVCVRVAIVAPGWWTGQGAASVPAAAAAPSAVAAAPPPAAKAAPGAEQRRPDRRAAGPGSNSVKRLVPDRRARSGPGPLIFSALPPLPIRPPQSGRSAAVPATAMVEPQLPSARRRWSGSAWILGRDEGGAAALAPGGTLGGSQAGARILYRLGGGLALSARVYAPLRRPRGTEAAAGLDWQPSARLPVHVLAERRQDLGGAGRSAFALSLHGGLSRDLRGGLRIDAYAQAGIVGTRSRDLFADASVRVSAPVGPIEVGGGAWGGAQPGAARLDAGPQISWRLPLRGANLRLSADWRFRAAGGAAPGSGPALTLAADF